MDILVLLEDAKREAKYREMENWWLIKELHKINPSSLAEYDIYRAKLRPRENLDLLQKLEK